MGSHLRLNIQTETESDGRWIAEIELLPGAICYGATASEAVARVKALALRIIADRIEHDEQTSGLDSITFAA